MGLAASSSSVMEFHIPCQWASIIIAVDGAPLASNAVSLEVVGHYETIPRPASVNVPREAAAYSPVALGAASAVNARADPVFADSSKKDRILQGVQAAAEGARRTVGIGKVIRGGVSGASAGRVGGPLGALAGSVIGMVSAMGSSTPRQPGTQTNYKIGSAFDKGASANHEYGIV